MNRLFLVRCLATFNIFAHLLRICSINFGAFYLYLYQMSPLCGLDIINHRKWHDSQTKCKKYLRLSKSKSHPFAKDKLTSVWAIGFEHFKVAQMASNKSIALNWKRVRPNNIMHYKFSMRHWFYPKNKAAREFCIRFYYVFASHFQLAHGIVLCMYAI